MDIIRIKKKTEPSSIRPDQRKPAIDNFEPIEPELKRKGLRKMWIIACPLVILALILIMAKVFILDSISSKEKIIPEISPEATNIANKVAALFATSNQTNQTASNAKTNTPNSSSPAPTPEKQAEIQQQEETAPANEEKTKENEPTANPSQSDKFITKSPVTISEITKISKFRSCANEAYGKTSFQDQQEPESSLKHYFNLKNSGIPVYAPFDGEIIREDTDSLVIETRPFNGWLIEISKINPENSLNQGSQIKSGDKIGKTLSKNLEVAESGFSKSQKEAKYEDYSEKNLDSFFSHLNDSVSKEFSDKGATADIMKVSKTDRDSKKCNFKPDNDEDWITLK
jgi:murein DD-endopeptidase MepM/ murein hydrolase activator NlpD